MHVEADPDRTLQALGKLDLVLTEQRQVGHVRVRVQEVRRHPGVGRLSADRQRVPVSREQGKLKIGAVARGAVEVVVVVEVVPRTEVQDLGPQLELEPRRDHRGGGETDEQVRLPLPVPQVDRFDFKAVLLRPPGEELLRVLALPGRKQFQGGRRPRPEDRLCPHAPPVHLAVLPKAGRTLAPREQRGVGAADLSGMLDLDSLYAQAFVGENQCVGGVEEAVVSPHHGPGFLRRRPRNHIDDTPQGVGAPERRVRPLDDLDPFHVQGREDPEVDRGAHSGERPVAVEQHEHPAAHASRQPAGTADVHLAGVEGHALREGKGLGEVGDASPLQLVAADHGDARGGVARMRPRGSP